ncbi:MAG: MFS transporter [Gammaproteobacteria bacterium]|nr:MFS transporter [Gammaproteobacteria bacterium]MYD01095.1 MFS transporter [Gammaproteobacteria bacterium]MYI25822.1 MFS transporter [Gammaproteobacteria bacterium]
MTDSTRTPGMLSPLSNPGFSMLWVANTLSLTAFWMTEVACAWQMRIMTDADPLAVAAVYTALQLPIMFLVIPAGVIADLSDRRRGMMWTHAWLAASMGVLLWLTWTGRITPLSLLVCMPLISIGLSMRMPAIAALIPEMVQTNQIPAAVSLNNVAQNGSRLVGPALAGAIIAGLGVAAVLALNTAIMALIVLLFLFMRYRPEQGDRVAKPQGFLAAIKEGVLFAALTPWKRNVLIRLSSFFACAAAIPALMAVRFDNSETYGIMYGCFGAGSLLGVLVIARLGYRRLNNRLNGGLVVGAVCIMLFGVVDQPLQAGPLLACIGASWLFCLNSIMVAAQMQLEPAIRGRGLSFIYTLGTASLADGGLIWGAVARAASPGVALIASGTCLLLALVATYRLSISAPGGAPAATSG